MDKTASWTAPVAWWGGLWGSGGKPPRNDKLNSEIYLRKGETIKMNEWTNGGRRATNCLYITLLYMYTIRSKWFAWWKASHAVKCVLAKTTCQVKWRVGVHSSCLHCGRHRLFDKAAILGIECETFDGFSRPGFVHIIPNPQWDTDSYFWNTIESSIIVEIIRKSICYSHCGNHLSYEDVYTLCKYLSLFCKKILDNNSNTLVKNIRVSCN